jgi:MATE family multidrug resistance protein
MAAVYFAVIPLVGTDDETRRAVGAYLLGRGPGTIAFLIYVAQRGYLQAVGRGPAIMWAMVVANLVNIPLDLALGQGDAALVELGLPAIGLPALGVLGIGVASTIVATAQTGVLWWTLRSAGTPREAAPSRAGAMAIVRIGWPIGLHFAGEMGIFTVVTVMAGGMGPVAAGGHQVALSLASFTFTVCLGISSATTVRVGSAIGAGAWVAAKRAGLMGIGVAAAFMTATAIIFAAIPHTLAGLIAQDAVVEAAVPLLYIAAVFQVFDGLQATAAGALRGASDTRVPMLISVAGYWLLGLPVGAGLAYGLEWGPAGLWWGLTTGLGVVGVALTRRFVRGAGALAGHG